VGMKFIPPGVVVMIKRDAKDVKHGSRAQHKGHTPDKAVLVIISGWYPCLRSSPFIWPHEINIRNKDMGEMVFCASYVQTDSRRDS